MNKVFKEDFAIFKKGINKGRIDWKNSVGKNIKFIYKNIQGVIKIEKYVYPNIIISYDNKTTTMHISQFKKCQLGSFLDIYNKNYLYNVGDIINNKIILKQIRVKQGDGTSKGYEYKCLVDGYVDKVTEVSMKENKCPICSGSKVLKGINDIATTHPHLIKYFVNIEDTYKYSYGSGKKIEFKCPDCNYQKQMKVATLSNYGFSCPKCGDGISYPNKFIFNLLEQLHIDFIPEKTFDWSYNRKYDFYIQSHNVIVEAMGNHHFEKSFDFKNGRSTKEEQENDKLKKQLAVGSGIEYYIVIDCRKSELEWIKNNIIKSELNELFDLNNIDWLKCEEFACSNRIKEICKLWNSELRQPKLSQLSKLSYSTIWLYLKKGTKLGWCNYNSNWYAKNNAERIKKLRSKQVEVFKNNECLGVFESVAELSRQSENLFGVKFSQSKISLICNGKRKHHKGYTFKYT